MLHLVVHHIAVEIDLAGVFRLKRPDFQVNDDKRPEPEMIKQQIDVKILSVDIEMHLPTDKSKTGAEFQQEPLKVLDQPRFQSPLAERFVQGP